MFITQWAHCFTLHHILFVKVKWASWLHLSAHFTPEVLKLNVTWCYSPSFCIDFSKFHLIPCVVIDKAIREEKRIFQVLRQALRQHFSLPSFYWFFHLFYLFCSSFISKALISSLVLQGFILLAKLTHLTHVWNFELKEFVVFFWDLFSKFSVNSVIFSFLCLVTPPNHCSQLHSSIALVSHVLVWMPHTPFWHLMNWF